MLYDKAFEIIHNNDPKVLKKYPKQMVTTFGGIMEKFREDRRNNPAMDKSMREKNVFPLTAPELEIK